MDANNDGGTESFQALRDELKKIMQEKFGVFRQESDMEEGRKLF
jgi:succinate dehydrogenase/fumarate reductase flavoprotein subunit